MTLSKAKTNFDLVSFFSSEYDDSEHFLGDSVTDDDEDGVGAAGTSCELCHTDPNSFLPHRQYLQYCVYSAQGA